MDRKKNVLICGNPNNVIRMMIRHLMEDYNIYFISYSKKSQFQEIKQLLGKNIYVNNNRYIHNIIVWLFFCVSICKRKKIDIFIAYTDNPIPNGLCMLLIEWLFPQIQRIFFPYDILGYAVPKEFKYQHKSRVFYFFDKICYEHAEKIITKGCANELKYLQSIYKVYNKPHFPFNFLIEKNDVTSNTNRKFDINKIKIVFIGGITKKDDCIDAFKKILKNKHISMHIYSHSTNKFKQNIGILDNIHYHKFIINHKDFIKEISQYDFGLSFSYSFEYEYIQSKMASGVRIYDYLSAELPIIIDDKHELMADFIKKNNFGIIMPVDDAEHIYSYIKDINYKEIIIDIRRNRKKYFVDSNINKLIAFIEK